MYKSKHGVQEQEKQVEGEEKRGEEEKIEGEASGRGGKRGEEEKIEGSVVCRCLYHVEVNQVLKVYSATTSGS